VPRWLWPPPGAQVQTVLVRERYEPATAQARFDVLEGEPPEARHLNALTWLLYDHEVGERPAGASFEGVVRLDIARTELASGRVGHSYAIDGGPLGAPSGAPARGLLLRYAAFVLGR
jgi:hypothetical protein